MNRPDSIRGVGLKNHLNQSSAKHRDKTYADFVEMVANQAPQRYISRAFGVNKNTVSKWVEIYKEESQK